MGESTPDPFSSAVAPFTKRLYFVVISNSEQVNRLQQDPAVIELVTRLCREFDPCAIYLFGSRVIGASDQSSDFDVIVIADSGSETPFQRARRSSAALQGFAYPVDVLVYSQSEWEYEVSRRCSIGREARDTGVCIYAA